LLSGGDLLFEGCDCLEIGFLYVLGKAVSVLSDVGYVGYVGKKNKKGGATWQGQVV
jgi:hypothetical protein